MGSVRCLWLGHVVSLARFAAQQHYASDIVAGGRDGLVYWAHVYKTHMDHAIHHHGLLKPVITPPIQPGAGTYARGLTFNLSDR